MIRRLEIRNFKSIRKATMNCRRVNIFIGEPNTGKSNILETLGVFAFGQLGGNFADFVRMDDMVQLFLHEVTSVPVEISADDVRLIIQLIPDERRYEILCSREQAQLFSFNYPFDGGGRQLKAWRRGHRPAFRFYRFVSKSEYATDEPGFLLPPSGDNMLSILRTNPDIKKEAGELFSSFGLRLLLRPREKRIEFARSEEAAEGIMVAYPYSLLSDTLQRLVFYLVALKSNREAVIVLEEPEVHSFPSQVQELGERIASDQNNQYFLTTHNPYLLLSILSKTRKEDLGVFAVSMKNYETQVNELTASDIEEVLGRGVDIFFNIERFVREE